MGTTKVKRKKRKEPNRRSGFEDKIEAQLKKAKVKYKYEPYKIKYVVPERSATYLPDFEFNGIILETKGKFTASDRKKMLLVIEQHPDRDIRILFMRDNFLRKGSKTKYSDWAKKNGVTYAIGEVPKEWLS